MSAVFDVETATTEVAQDVSSLLRRQRVILVADLVESVRLLILDEINAITRWRLFVENIRSTLLPRTSGRIVKSLGDGVLTEFNDVPSAVSAALAMHAELAALNKGQPGDASMWLRIGIHIADVFVDRIDVYGAGVNLAARLASLARPGEVVISAEARDRIVDGLHGDLEDLGESYLKHIPEPVRAFRLRPAGITPDAAWRPPDNHHAVLAVVPFALVCAEAQLNVIGDALAECIIGRLSNLPSLQLISRLSTSPLRDSIDPVGDSHALLRANYVLTGHYTLAGDQINVRCTLSAAAEGEVLWQGAHHARLDDLFGPDEGFVPEIVAQVGRAVVRREVTRARRLPLRKLDNYALYISGISLMHRMSAQDFGFARLLFEQLEQRLPRNAAPKAMLAKWHLMRQLQGWSEDASTDSRKARDFARQALDQDGDHGFALATKAFVSAHIDGDLPGALNECLRALELDPQEAQCWRMAAGIHSYLGDGSAAQACAEQALALTPLDPTRFIYELVLGAAKLASGNYVQALALADSSLRRNSMHLPTHRLRVIALAMAGRDAEARTAAGALMALSPSFCVRDFKRAYPGRQQHHAAEYFSALHRAGIPNEI